MKYFVTHSGLNFRRLEPRNLGGWTVVFLLSRLIECCMYECKITLDSFFLLYRLLFYELLSKKRALWQGNTDIKSINLEKFRNKNKLSTGRPCVLVPSCGALPPAPFDTGCPVGAAAAAVEGGG